MIDTEPAAPAAAAAPMLSVIVPVYNEAPHLVEVLDYLLASTCPVQREWIFVDDCSSDGSATILDDLAPTLGFRLLRQATNQGKGAAIIRGISEAQGDLIMIQDADFEYDPDDVPSLLEPLLADRADVVFGSRFRRSLSQVHRTYHYFINRLLTELSNLFSGIYLTDMETCYKIFRADLLKSMNLTSKRFGIEVELTAYTAKSAARIAELPIHYYPRTHLHGKKINWKDGFAALWHLFYFNVIRGDTSAFTQLPAKYDPTRRRSELYLARVRARDAVSQRKHWREQREASDDKGAG